MRMDEQRKMFSNPEGNKAVVEWLAAYNISAKVTKSKFFVRAVGSVAAVEKALGAKYMTFENKKKRAGRTQTIHSSLSFTVPVHLHKYIAVVDHVTNFLESKIKPHYVNGAQVSVQSAANLSSGSGGLDFGNVVPSTLYEEYGIGTFPPAAATITDNSKNHIGLWEDGSYTWSSDLDTFDTAYKVPKQTFATAGASNDFQDCESYYGIDQCGEASLDIQYLTAIAAGTKTTMWWASGSSSGSFAAGFNDWADYVLGLSAADQPTTWSVSYGLDESDTSSSLLDSTNDNFKKLGVAGITIFVASGDAGISNYRGGYLSSSTCGWNPSFPAASPYVTAVGATQYYCGQGGNCGGSSSNIKGKAYPQIMSSGGNSYGTQVTSGGGFSCHNAAPSWQQGGGSYKASVSNTGAKPASGAGTCSTTGTSSHYNANGRGYPDLVALGWGYVIYVGGQKIPGIAGTSAASPVTAGMIASINAQRLKNGKAPLGFLNPKIYLSTAQAAGITTDIGPSSASGIKNTNACGTSGAGCCTTEGTSVVKGWDATTGWGSLDYPNALAHLGSTLA